MNGEQLEEADAIKYLGVTLTKLQQIGYGNIGNGKTQ